jgi:type I restriction enzyme S subunit
MPTEQQHIPMLRFPEFSDEWNEMLLDDYAVRGSGHTPSKAKPEYYNGEINWVSLTDSNKLDKGFIKDTNKTITQLGINNSSAVLHPAGTVLLSRDAGVGKSAVMKYPMAVSQHFIVWKPILGYSSSWFLYNWLQIMKPKFERIAVGSTIKTIGLPYFKKLKIITPTYPEQKKITTFLSSIDTRIEDLTQKKALLEQYKKGMMQKLFSQEIRFKDDVGNDYPDWEEKKLGDIANFRRGSFPQPYGLPEWYDDNGYPFVQVFDVGNSFRLKPTTKQRISEVAAKQSVFVPNGSIVLTIQGSIGRIAITQYDSYVDRTLLIFTSFNEKLSVVFFAHVIYLLFEIEKRMAPGGTIKTITKQVLSDFTFKMPCYKEQQKIALLLSSLDEKIDFTTNQLKQAQIFKKGLLQQMFV